MSGKSIEKLHEDFIYKSRYARWDYEKGRRENWEETIERYFNFMRDRVPESLLKSFEKAKNYVLDLQVMPSMRALWSAGPALEKENVAAYNCAAIAVSYPKVFADIMYLLLNGTGVGISVERQFINELPKIVQPLIKTEDTIVVEDSKQGWAQSIFELITYLFDGRIPNIDVSKVRPAGSILKTFGGRASGPEPLLKSMKFIIRTFKNVSEDGKLSSLDCHDIACSIAESVVVGGVRRSALISLSNLSDLRMRHAKDGSYWTENPQRALANNSVAYTEKPSMKFFLDEWTNLMNSGTGERGIFNREAARKKIESIGRRDPEYQWLCNPCAEIFLRETGGLCNLTEVIVRPNDSLNTLQEKVKYATILGILQSTLTDFNFINDRWKKNAEEERLLGVSLSGIMDHHILSNEKKPERMEDWLSAMKETSINVAKKWSKELQINMPVAISCCKPSGCITSDTKLRTSEGILSMNEIFESSDILAKQFTKKSLRKSAYEMCKNEIAVDVDEEEVSNLQYSMIENAPRNVWFDYCGDIKVYDENNELKNITKLYFNGYQEVYNIYFEDGNVYTFTGNHKLKTIKGWKRVDEITLDDEIIIFENGLKNEIGICDVTKEEEEFTVDIEVENTHSYQLSNGVVSHNTVSLRVGCAPGIHPRWSQYYIRRVRNSKNDPITKFLMDKGVPWYPENGETRDNYLTAVFEFPLRSPSKRCIMRGEKSAIEQLEHWKIVNEVWCEHEPSITVYVKDDEWLEVGAWVYKNWDMMSGVSFLPYDNGIYSLTPFEEIDEETYKELVKRFPKGINFDDLTVYESDDYTEGAQELACVSGACLI